jgi:tetratricopeptide (TPR) repeat protein
VPVIGLVQVGSQSFADRYTYIPSIGLLIALVWTAADLVESRAALRTAIAVFVIVLASAASVLTVRQVALWKNTKTLFTQALAVTSRNAVAHQNLGNALLLEGDVDAAIGHLEEALRIVPDFPDAHNNLGSALGNKQRFDEAIAHFKAALLVQDTAGTHYNLGFALVQAGRGDEALAEYARALELDPDLPAAHAALGAALAARGRLDEAALHLARALALDPEKIETHRSMAITRTLQGRVEEGVAEYRQVLSRAPEDLDAMNNIAWIRATHTDAAHRNGADAVRLAETARDAAHDPNHVLQSTLAAAYAEVGRFEDAISAGQRAVELARAAKDLAAVQRYEVQIECYRRKQPFHQ